MVLLVSSRLPSRCLAFCEMDAEDMGKSLWSDFADEAVFLPVSQREAFAALVTQADELTGVLQYFKRRYVSFWIPRNPLSGQESQWSSLLNVTTQLMSVLSLGAHQR